MLGERIPAEQALDWGMIAASSTTRLSMPKRWRSPTRLAQGPTVALGLIRRLARDSAHARSAMRWPSNGPPSATPAAPRISSRAVIAFLQKRRRSSTAASRCPVELWLAYGRLASCSP